MNSQTIGLALSARRQKLRIDKGQAADRIGMSRTTYSSYEQDRQRPSVDVFPALAEFLEVSMEDFLLLYGATAIVAVRPALEKVLLAQAARHVDVRRDEARLGDYRQEDEGSEPLETAGEPDETNESPGPLGSEVAHRTVEAPVERLSLVESPKKKSKNKKKKKSDKK